MGDRVETAIRIERQRTGSIDESSGANPRNHRRRHSRQSSTYSHEQLRQLDRIGSDFRLQRDLQRALAELSAREEEYREAVEIQGRLEGENEDLLQQIDTLTQNLSEQIIDIKVLQQKCSTLEELYNDEHQRYEAEIKNKEDQVAALEAEVYQRDGELEDIVQELENHQNQVHENVEDVLRQSSTESTVVDLDHASRLELTTDLERDLYQRLVDERKKTKDASRKVDTLLFKLESSRRYEFENEDLRRELEDLQALQNDEVERANQTNKAISDEIVAVAKRNATLQQELDDMQALLEDKEYNIRMLEAELDMDRVDTARDMGVSSLGDDLGAAIQEMRAEAQMLAQATRVESPRLSSGGKTTAGESQQEEHKRGEDVPDVLKEYLHLTASAVKIKFPQVQTITSEQLIEKVQKLSFFQYHDAMVRIMKNEEAKMKQKEQEQAIRAKKAALAARENQTVFGRIAAFFTNGEPDKEQIEKQANRDFQEVSPVVSQTRHHVKNR